MSLFHILAPCQYPTEERHAILLTITVPFNANLSMISNTSMQVKNEFYPSPDCPLVVEGGSIRFEIFNMRQNASVCGLLYQCARTTITEVVNVHDGLTYVGRADEILLYLVQAQS